MFLTLLKVRFRQMFLGGGNKKNKKGKVKSSVGMIILFTLLYLYLAAVLGVMFGSAFFMISMTLDEVTKWVMIALAAVLAFALMTLGSVFVAKNLLYEAKDNDLLLSMPIPPSMILASRVFSLLLLNYIFGTVVFIPCAVVYGIVYGFGVLEFILFVVGFLLLGLLSLAIICALAFLIELVTRRLRNKNVITMVFSLGFLALYMYFYSNMNTIMESAVNNFYKFIPIIEKWLKPAYFLGLGVSNLDFVSFLLYTLCALIPFGIVYYILSKSFISIATTSKNVGKIKYKEKEMKVSGALWALTKKEIKLFLSLPAYMMNAGLGVIFAVGVSVLAVVKKGVILEALSSGFGMTIDINMIYSILILALVFMCSMNLVSAPSISLEGRKLWIAKSIPVSGETVLLSKVLAHCIICLPFMVLSGLILWIGMGMSWYMGIFTILIPSLFTVILAFFGVLFNLKFHKFEWVNEAVPVKQGLSVLLTMLLGWAIPAAIAIAGFFLAAFSPVLYLVIVTLAFTLIAAVLYLITKNCTAKAFRRLD